MNNDHDVVRLVTDSFDKSMKKRMRKRLLNHSGLLTLFLISALSVLVLNACATGTEEDTGLPTIAATAAAADETTGIGATVAFETVLAFVNQRYGETAPSADLLWTTENITPVGLVGLTTFQYTAETCVATVSYPIVAPDATIFHVDIVDEATGFVWAGEVDAAGQVTELSAFTGAPEQGEESTTQAEVEYQPLSDSAGFAKLVSGMEQILGVEVVLAEEPFQDLIGKSGTSRQATAKGTGLDFDDIESVAQELSELLRTYGWREDLMYQADGPTGTTSGFHRYNEFCLVNVGWVPSEDADCPPDQPLAMCELEPELQLYTISVACAEDTTSTTVIELCWPKSLSKT